MDKQERIREWAVKLDFDQMVKVIMEMVGEAIEEESISFHEDNVAPYWRNTGEPLVEGQECFD